MTGRLWGLGVGPGDPELVTLKAYRILRDADVVAWFAATGRESNARRAVAVHLRPGQEELPLIYPVTTETLPAEVSYEGLLAKFYDEAAASIGALLDDGRDVAVLCEGDPLFYGSYMYLHNRLAAYYDHEVVPGVPSMLAGAAVLGTPLVSLNEMLTVLSGVLPADELYRRLVSADAVVIMKLGRNLAKVRDCVERAGLLARAWYVERATMEAQRVLPLADADAARAPYFSLVVIPSATAPGR
ncbi:precorrin-2 C(20)-methyltransferase [Acidiferrimicrobium sp. IK]|uniref:precorrin-2 C(20)-methyltransferase n=1 Tax=Acidiferrimicrobium sp. IK TaxID=2871700 RepID=UPI0021CB59B1|nr:precorrin-2 C(20)-methyltransferase [Acidiferrimicrobium sp. IK]MCU4186275.1 precorrin-2 C(20)-methyltransferase [Acidiferrimicrobium sp. IK]